MACPFFYATRPVLNWMSKRPMPLGDVYEGECRAQANGCQTPESLLLLCNLGYARGECPRFPSDAQADAVRFAVSRDDGERFFIRYVLERDHLPWAHGVLEFHAPSGSFTPPLTDPVVHRLAVAYAQAYLRRRPQLTPNH